MIGDGNLYEDSIQFVCALGFDLVGANESKCLDTGNWSVEVPQCNRKCYHIVLQYFLLIVYYYYKYYS